MQSPTFFDAIRAEALTAWNTSYLRDLPTELRDSLLRSSHFAEVAAGSTIYDPYAPPKFALIHTGLARVQAMSLDGRAVTVRYAGPGQIIGLPAAINSASPVGAHAVTACRLSWLNVDAVQRNLRRNIQFSNILLQETCTVLFEALELLTENLFGSIQQRVCRHLLDLARETPDGLVVEADQHSIADSIGSVREVVARALRKLREMGAIERVPAGLLIVNRSLVADVADAARGLDAHRLAESRRTRGTTLGG